MEKQIAIYGAGGLGRELLSLFNMLPEWEVIGFYDDGIEKGKMIRQLPILGGMPELLAYEFPLNLVLAIGDPKIKSALSKRLSNNKHLDFPILIHPAAILQERQTIRLGKGVVVTAGTILTTDVTIGNHVLLNLNCTIGHDVIIGNCCSIMPGVNVAGDVKIGNNVLIGSGSNILNGLSIGDESCVGSGAVVTKRVENGVTVAGVPAVAIHKTDN